MDIKLAQPILKWAGGKRQLIPQLEPLYPDALKKNEIQKYVEPFAGGAALFFDLKSKYTIDNAILNDANADLIVAYKVVRDAVSDLISILNTLSSDYLALSAPERELMYYAIRSDFNQSRLTMDYDTVSPQTIAQAARMIFLNKTCFNGLHRVNQVGDFNVSHGKYKHPCICDVQNLESVHHVLQGVTLLHGDFEELTNAIDRNTFVFLDPPYRPLNATSSFTAYATSPFDDNAQLRLAHWFKQLHFEKGASLMLCNSDPTNTDPDDRFFDNLYADYDINRVNASRAINSIGERRGPVREIVVTNYE